MKRNKRGISLIVLVITIIVPYYETLKASKIGKNPPKNIKRYFKIAAQTI